MHRVSANQFHSRKSEIPRNHKVNHSKKNPSYIPGVKISLTDSDLTKTSPLGTFYDVLFLVARAYAMYRCTQVMQGMVVYAHMQNSSAVTISHSLAQKNETASTTQASKYSFQAIPKQEMCYVYVEQHSKMKVKKKKKRKKKTKKFEQRSFYTIPVPCPRKTEKKEILPPVTKEQTCEKGASIEEIKRLIEQNTPKCPEIPPCPTVEISPCPKPDIPPCPHSDLPQIATPEELASVIHLTIQKELEGKCTWDDERLNELSSKIIKGVGQFEMEDRFEKVIEATLTKFLSRECPPCEDKPKGGFLDFFSAFTSSYLDDDDVKDDPAEVRLEYYARKFIETAGEISGDRDTCYETLRKIYNDAKVTLKKKPMSL